jgi:thioredoxin reductase
MLFDCAIIGGGPAGLNAALVLGRAKRNVVLFDDNQPRNAVTQESHGFLTRDGVEPNEFRNIAHQEISRYPSVAIRPIRITDVSNYEDSFELVASDGTTFDSKTVILATGLKETLPAVEGISDYYGKSIFGCPYCDGWERRDQPLLVISETPHAFQYTTIIWNWSRDLLLCTNGHQILTREQKEKLQKKEIQVFEDSIAVLVGKNGMLERVVFSTGEEVARTGGFMTVQWTQAAPFASLLGCNLNEMGGPTIDMLGRTSVKGVYAAGEVTLPSQLIVSAAQGSAAAAGVNTDLIQSEFM